MNIQQLCSAFRKNRWFIGLVTYLMICVSAEVGFAANERIMPLGDSITQADQHHNSYRRALWFKLKDAGYTPDFVGSLDTNHPQSSPPNPDFDMDHEAHWGWRTDQLLVHLPGWLQGYTPDIVLLHAGANDLYQQFTLQSIVDNFKSIIDTLRSDNPEVTILLSRLYHTNQSQDHNARIAAFNALMPDIVAEKDTAQSPIIIVDQNSGFSAPNDTYDGLHPNAQGEEKIARKWFDALVGILPEPVDITPPVVEQVEVNSDGTEMTLTFSEPVDSATANDIAHYAIDQEIDVLGVRLKNDMTTVTLTVSALTLDTTYALTVLGVRDLADPPNAADTVFRFSFRSVSRFNDDFQRPDGDTIGNGWIEKGAGLFFLNSGEVMKSSGGVYQDNIVYRPLTESYLDMEASIAFRMTAIAATYPQLHFRIAGDSIADPGSLDSYLIWIYDYSTARISRSDGSSGHTTLVSITLSESMAVGEQYRLRASADGEDPVVLNGFVEKWNGSTWIEIGSGYYEDSAPSRKGPGTAGFSDHTAGNTVYDNFNCRSPRTPDPPSPPTGFKVVPTASLPN